MPCREAAAATPLTTVRVASGLSLPLYVTAPPGDTNRVFVVEQRAASSRGRVRIIKNGTLLPTPFLITDSLATGGEQGLLGLAFPPDYATSGRFYIKYTDSTGTNTLERRTVSANPDIANPTGQVLLTIPHPYTNHNGGWIGFGPDGYLYVAEGDGGSGGDPEDRAQNINEHLGKILRLDVSGATYTSPPGNPYLGATPGLDEIWSYGLRNPWRCSFDRKTGDFIIADVGQNVWEEVDFMPAGTGAGANYGWRCFEGNTPFASSLTIPCGSCAAAGCPKTFPAHEYSHGGVRCSITGGYVYRGCAIPDLAGTYFFADYCSNQIWSGRFQGGLLVGVVDATADLAPAGFTINNITSFGEDGRGEVYICDQTGEVFKIVPQSPVQEADMLAIEKQTPLGDTLGSSGVGNALLTGIVPFTDPGSRISGVGYLSAATIRECAETLGNCLTSHVRLAPFDIDLQACVDSIGGTLTRRFVFTNTATGPRNLAYRDVITPQLRGDPDGATRVTAASTGQSAVLTQYDAMFPDRWIVHSGTGSIGVAYSADIDTAAHLEARVLADQPLLEGTSAGPAAVGLALGFDFGSLPAGDRDTVTVTTRIQTTSPTGVDSGPPPPAPKAQLSFLGPVPFRTELLMEIGLPQTEEVSLDIFDLAGRRVRTLMRGITPAGRTPFRWDGRIDGGANAASGIYFLRLSSTGWSLTRRIALVR